METVTPTVATNPVAEGNDTPPPDSERTLTELTRCLSEAYTARGRIRLERGEFGLALSDLNEALRQDPGNTEALRLRGVIEQQTGEGLPTEDAPHQSDLGEPVSAEDGPRQTRFEAGYQVMARYDNGPAGGEDPLLSPLPLTDEGRLKAIEFARQMCSDDSRSQRRELHDANWTSGEDFDAVVIEFRSLTRVIHLEKAIDEDGQPILE